ncbi:hypothetical protein BGZ54_004329 [Gamsiella multidivaricata]|nr:hypothetical protein BGZ54_004329 [Gamsiella multidivaricata]
MGTIDSRLEQVQRPISHGPRNHQQQQKRQHPLPLFQPRPVMISPRLRNKDVPYTGPVPHVVSMLDFGHSLVSGINLGQGAVTPAATANGAIEPTSVSKSMSSHGAGESSSSESFESATQDPVQLEPGSSVSAVNVSLTNSEANMSWLSSARQIRRLQHQKELQREQHQRQRRQGQVLRNGGISVRSDSSSSSTAKRGVLSVVTIEAAQSASPSLTPIQSDMRQGDRNITQHSIEWPRRGGFIELGLDSEENKAQEGTPISQDQDHVRDNGGDGDMGGSGSGS